MLKTKPPLRVAFIGAGWIVARVWCPLIRELGCEVAAVIDPRLSQPDAAAAFGEHVVAFPEAVPQALAGCNLAIICSPNRYHVDHAVLALQQGLDVILDKPACLDLESAERLIEAARDANRSFWVTAASSARNDVGIIRGLIGDRQVGEIHCVDASWRRASGVPHPGSWFTSRELALGGSSVDLGWHLLEVALGLMDYPQVTAGLSHQVIPPAISADQGIAWRQDIAALPQNIPVDVDTQLYAALRCESGQLIRLSTAWVAHGTSDCTSISVYGSEGEITLETLFGFSQNRQQPDRLILCKNGSEQVLPLTSAEKVAPYRRFLQGVLAAFGNADRLRNGQALEVTKLRSIVSAYRFIQHESAARNTHI